MAIADKFDFALGCAVDIAMRCWLERRRAHLTLPNELMSAYCPHN
jgi:hypothetical protein